MELGFEERFTEGHSIMVFLTPCYVIKCETYKS